MQTGGEKIERTKDEKRTCTYGNAEIAFKEEYFQF